MATGGTEVYAFDLARSLRRQGHEVAVLTRQADAGCAEYSVANDVVDGIAVARINNTFLHAASFEDTYRNATIEEIAARVIDGFQPDVVHVHHLTCLSTGIVGLCRRRGIPAIVTLQDYWLLCHRGQLLDLDLARCEGPQADRCASCAGVAASPLPALHHVARTLRAVERRLPPRLGTMQRRLLTMAARRRPPAGASGVTAARLKEARSVWDAATCLLAPSQTVFDRFVRFGAAASKMRRQEQGIDLSRFQGVARASADRLRLGFVGSLMVSKAPHLLLEAAAGLPPGRVSVTVAGGLTAYHGDDTYASRIRPLLEQPGVRWMGVVAHERVPVLLSGIDVVVVPSIWIENSPFVIKEAQAAGAVVVASRLGGMAEAVSDGETGLLFEPGSAGDLRRVLSRLLDEPDLLGRLRARTPPVKSIDDDAAWTARVYEESRRDATRQACPAVASVAGVILNYRTPADTLLAARSLEASRRPVSPIVVVDNGGDPDCERLLAAGRAEVRVVRTTTNLGFSGGCNVGTRDALARGAGLVLLLNSDAVVAPDTLGRLEALLAAEPRAGIVAPLVVSRAEPGVVSSAGIAFSTFSGRMRHHGFGRRTEELASETPRRVTAASGCAMLVRRAVFEQAGLFDERYFYTFEDIDFCRRAARAGWETWVVPSALVYHEGHRSIGPESSARLYYAARNHLLLARTIAPLPRPASWLRAAGIVFLNAAYAARAGNLRTAAGLLAVARGTRDHLRRRYGAAPATSAPPVRAGARP